MVLCRLVVRPLIAGVYLIHPSEITGEILKTEFIKGLGLEHSAAQLYELFFGSVFNAFFQFRA
jgi:hypothetical protein